MAMFSFLADDLDIDYRDAEWFTDLIERAINGVELPDCAGVRDSEAVQSGSGGPGASRGR